MNSINAIEIKASRPGVWGGMLAAACLAVLLVIIFPLSEKILDILWICSFCLSLGVSLICIAAKRSSDLMGFIPMMAGLILLRLISLLATASHVIRDEPAGFLTGLAGSVLGMRWPLGLLMVCLVSVLIVIAIIFISCQKITLVSKGYLQHIFPLKRMGINTDLQLGVINTEQARQLAERIISECNFFSGMSRIGLFMRIESVVYVVILLMCLVVLAANNSISSSSDTGILSAIVGSVAAMAIFTYIPAMVVAIACAVLMSRNTLALQSDQTEPPAARHVKKIKVAALDSDTPENDCSGPEIPSRTGEYVVEFEPQEKALSAEQSPVLQDISCRNEKEYYEELSRIICSVREKSPVILLVSEEVNALPVTVPINIAIRLSRKGQKVLLVDADPQRNAVASVFDLEPEVLRTRVVSSCLENLSVYSVPKDRLHRFLNQETILSRFDTALVYAPQVPLLKSSCGNALKPGAIYFIDDKTDGAGRHAVESLGYCGWVELAPSIQSVLKTQLQS